MKTHLQMDVLKDGHNNKQICHLIGLHNQGSINIDLSFIAISLQLEKSLYPLLNDGLCCTINKEKSCLYISEDNEITNTVIIDLIELYELNEEQSEMEDDWLEALDDLDLHPKEHPIVNQLGGWSSEENTIN